MAAIDHLSRPQFFTGTATTLGATVDPSQPHARNHQASFPNSAYFTDRPREAAAYAKLAQRKGTGTGQHVYAVEPTGAYHPDMTQRQGGSYTTKAPLKVTGKAVYIAPPGSSNHYIRPL